MVKFCFLVFIIFLISFGVRSQEINQKVTYIATTNIATLKKFGNIVGKRDRSSSMDEIYAIMEETSVQFELLISDNRSLYQVKNELVEQDYRTEIAHIGFGASDKFYINLDDQEFIHQLNAYDDLFLLPMEKRRWELSKDSKKIGGYACYKANTNYSVTNSAGTFYKHVTAWYAPKIKWSFGPRGYYGLPGLILQLQDDKLLFTATDINLNEKTENKIVKPTEGKKMSIEEFDKMGKLYSPF